MFGPDGGDGALGAGVAEGTVDGAVGAFGAGGHGGDEREADSGVDEGLDGLELRAAKADARGRSYESLRDCL
ncbi:MAG: hypothetical protein BGO12_13020 [Verrucomicrobia bacterium 61-8]|nr:MAG: hypothetical protein BGO12_13020 [Verrucomicrobia bacterium 61-8]